MAKNQTATIVLRMGLVVSVVCFVGISLLTLSSFGNGTTAGADGFRLCGRSWVDVDGNGLQEGGDHGGDQTLGGVEVTLTDQSGLTKVLTTSEPSGSYFFSALEEGRYTVSFAEVQGYSRTLSVASIWSSGPRISVVNQSSGKSVSFSLPQDANSKDGSPCTISNVDAGYLPDRQPTRLVQADMSANINSISRIKSKKLDNAVKVPVGYETHLQVLDTEFSKLPAYVVQVNDSNIPGSVAVDETNQIVIDRPTSAGLYKVSYDIRFNGDLLYSSELLVEAEDGSGDDYSICGRTFDDKNRNNEQDPDDSVLNGVSVALYDEKGSIVRGPFETFKGGNYAFRGLRAGSYYVEFDVPVSHAEFVVANRGGNTRWDSDVIDAGVTRIINLPIDSNQGEKKTATCTVNWIDAGFR